ncbi:MAG: hypothetical protein K2Y37_02300 [Pirellulales bacterium]|nr:hypothetical protein [Pirellulales bacterium]
MSQSTTLHLVAGGATWEPSRDFLEQVFSFLEANKLYIVSGNPLPLYWDRPRSWDTNVNYLDQLDADVTPEEQALIESQSIGKGYFYTDISVERAFEIWRAEPACCTLFLIGHYGAWARRLANSLEWVPKELASNYLGPWDSAIWVGPSSIPDRDGDYTVAETNCQVTLGAYGCPTNLDEYFAILKDHPQVQALHAFLERESGVPWSMHFLLS